MQNYHNHKWFSNVLVADCPTSYEAYIKRVKELGHKVKVETHGQSGVKNKFTKVYHYRNVEEELVLIKYSNNTYIEQQKIDVLTWLNSKRGKRLWDNSFWKTFDVIRLLHYMNDESFTSVISQIIDAIVYKDDKNKSHYKTDGSYDGVLAPTCGTLELLKWAKNNEYYAKTQNYLINKFYTEENVHNKMFIIRSFACSSDPELSSILENFSIESITNLKDLTDLDLCLYIEIAIILYNNLEKDKSVNKQWIIFFCWFFSNSH